MKKLFVILILLVITFNSYSQYSNPNNYRLKRLVFYTAVNALDATGDALNNTGHKEWGHLSEAAALGVMFYIPFDRDMRLHFKNASLKDFIVDAIIMVGTRYVVFNYVYNAVAGLPMNYYGDTDYFDQINRNFGNFGKVVTVTFIIALSSQQ